MESADSAPTPTSPTCVAFAQLAGSNENKSDGEEEEAARIFQENGYLHVTGCFSPEEIEEMRREMGRIVDEMDSSTHPLLAFVADGDGSKHIADRYFLDSVDQISFFYEQKAIDPASKQLVVAKEAALNKVGHAKPSKSSFLALHWLDPVFKKHTFSHKIKKLVRMVGFRQPHVVQSMYIFKQPNIGGAVGQHRDSTFLHVGQTPASISHPPEGIERQKDHHCSKDSQKPAENVPRIQRPRLIGVWIALEDATLENGCLWFAPGSHRRGRMSHDGGDEHSSSYKFVRSVAEQLDGDGCAEREAPVLLKFLGEKEAELGDGAFVPVEVTAGSLVLIDGDVVHKSGENRSAASRHAYTFHVVDIPVAVAPPLSDGMKNRGGREQMWPASNWLQETERYKFPCLYNGGGDQEDRGKV